MIVPVIEPPVSARFPDAVPVKAPVKPDELTEVNPTRVVAVPPRATFVEPIVIDEFVRAEFGIEVSEAPEPENVPPVTVPVTVSELRVPTDVSDDETTFEARVVPVRVPAAAVTVPEPPSEIDVPFTVTDEFARYAFTIGVAFQVPEVIVPTEVREDETIVEFRDVPVRVPAAAVTVPEPPRAIDVPFTVSDEFAR